MIASSVCANTSAVITAKAGIQGHTHRRKLPWNPAFAGMTMVGVEK